MLPSDVKTKLGQKSDRRHLISTIETIEGKMQYTEDQIKSFLVGKTISAVKPYKTYSGPSISFIEFECGSKIELWGRGDDCLIGDLIDKDGNCVDVE